MLWSSGKRLESGRHTVVFGADGYHATYSGLSLGTTSMNSTVLSKSFTLYASQ